MTSARQRAAVVVSAAIASNYDSGDAVKIGYAAGPDARVATLRTANPNGIVVLGVMDGASAEEKALHDRFQLHHLRGEWFVLADEILRFIEDNCRPSLSRLKKVGVTPLPHTPGGRDRLEQYVQEDRVFFWALMVFLLFGLVSSYTAILIAMRVISASLFFGLSDFTALPMMLGFLVLCMRGGWLFLQDALADIRYRRIIRAHSR